MSPMLQHEQQPENADIAMPQRQHREREASGAHLCSLRRHGRMARAVALLLPALMLPAVLLLLAMPYFSAASGFPSWLSWLVAALALLGLGVAQFVLWRGRREMRTLHERQDDLQRQLRQQRQQATDAAAQRARMLAVITHELRTPLSGMLGMAALLRGTSLTPEQANYVQALDGSARLLLSMVNELMETARAEATGAMDAGVPVVERPFDPVRMVEEVCELLSARAHARALSLACFVDPRIEGEWLGDETRLKQVLLNLLGNALKFTRQGGVMVRLEPVGDGLQISVADTGPGVPQDMERRICEPFARAAVHDVGREGGAGLGLAIVQQLLRAMDGRLELENRPGHGATFRAIVPLRPVAAHDASAARNRGPECAVQALAGVAVALLVPDAMHRRALADYVTALGGVLHVITPEELPQALRSADREVVVDAAHARELRQVLQDAAQMVRARIWLLLMPEQRLALHDLMQHPQISGWLLKPLRRQTIIERLAHGGVDAALDASVRQLRTMVQQAHARGDDDAAFATAPGNASGDAPLVLLAEDDPVNAQVARMVLQRLGCVVRHFTDGAALLRAVRQHLLDAGKASRPLCVLLDLDMPEMDGLEAAQAIRQLEHALQVPRLPLIALTAGDAGIERERCLAAGMDGFLSKPLDEMTLASLLQQLKETQGSAASCLPRSRARSVH